jgi:hypothetical protein
MGLKDTLRKAAGLLVELPPETEAPAAGQPGAASTPASAGAGSGSARAELDRLFADLESASPATPKAAKTVEQIVRDSSGPNLDEIEVPVTAPPPVTTPDGRVDFTAIYTQAGLPAVTYTAEQMLEMLASLPPDLPLETKRQTVNVTLASLGKAIGATSETIVADASRKLAALAAYGEQLSRQTAELVANTELEIAALQAQIDEKRKAIQAAQHHDAEVTKLCEAESDRLDDILEFFTLDLPPSKHAPSGS